MSSYNCLITILLLKVKIGCNHQKKLKQRVEILFVFMFYLVSFLFLHKQQMIHIEFSVCLLTMDFCQR